MRKPTQTMASCDVSRKELLRENIGSDNGGSVDLAIFESESLSESGKIRCGHCGREFRPDFAHQRFCDHACYSASISVPIQSRFWSKVNRSGPVPEHRPDLGPCWLWTASTIRGYGQIAGVLNGKKRPLYAHRVSWEMAHGAIPDGLSVLHGCDEPLCVNPDHLFLGTQEDNLRDAREKGRLLPRGVYLERASHALKSTQSVS